MRARIRNLLLPFVLRRLKTDPALNLQLPAKTETTHPVALSRDQIGLLEALSRDSEQQMNAVPYSPRIGSLVLDLIRGAKKICNSPAHYSGQTPAMIRGDVDAAERQAPKLATLHHLLRDIRERGQSALIFTTYTGMAKLLHAYLDARGYRPRVYYGELPHKHKAAALAALACGETTVLIMTIQSGGIGLNLTTANHVIHDDRHWNPALEAQASDRVYRIGQNRDVAVHYLVCANSVEERITALLERKRGLADAFLPSGELNLTQLTADELAGLWNRTPDR